MAANLQGGRLVAGGFGKRLVNQIWAGGARDPAPLSTSPVSAARRGVQTSVYDKNLDDQVRPSAVPDHVIQPESDKYWAPDPNTGVFGPVDQQNGPATAARTSTGNGGVSVLDQTAWFRPLEDIEKPPPPHNNA